MRNLPLFCLDALLPRRLREASRPAAGAGSTDAPPDGSAVGVAEGDVVLDAIACDRAELFADVGHHLQAAYGLDRKRVVQALEHRERIGSTAVGEGVALPHARLEGLKTVRCLYMRLAVPMRFDPTERGLVTHVFVILVPKEASQLHLDVLARVSGCFSDPDFRNALRCSSRRDDVVRLFAPIAGPHAWHGSAAPGDSDAKRH